MDQGGLQWQPYFQRRDGMAGDGNACTVSPDAVTRKSENQL